MGLHDGMWPSYMWTWLLQRKRAGVSYLQKEDQVCMYRRKGKGCIQQSVYVCVCLICSCEIKAPRNGTGFLTSTRSLFNDAEKIIEVYSSFHFPID